MKQELDYQTVLANLAGALIGLMISWLVNGWLIVLFWNIGIVKLLSVPPITWLQAVCVYSIARVLLQKRVEDGK